MKININKLIKYNPKNNLPLEHFGIHILNLKYPKHLLEKIRQQKTFI